MTSTKRRWEISRRACLRGAGTAIGLPLLEAMLPGIERARAAGEAPPKYFVVFTFTGGTPETTGIQAVTEPGGDPGQVIGRPGCLKPANTGPGYQTTRLLQPFADLGLKQDILVISNLENSIARPGQGKYAGGDHPRSEMGILTGMSAENSDGSGRALGPGGISVDQAVANEVKKFKTGLSYLYLGNPLYGENAHINCWGGPTAPLSAIVRPTEAFYRVFGGDGTTDSKTAQRRLAYRKSVLDHARADITRLRAKSLGRSDRDTLDKYFTSIETLEQQIFAASSSGGDACKMPPGAANDDASTPELTRQMLDIITLAFQCDATRVAVFALHSHALRFEWLGPPNSNYPSWHDDIEHGGSAPQFGFLDHEDRTESYIRGSAWQLGQFAYLAGQLKKVATPDGSLLYNTIGVCTSEFSYGNGHDLYRLPVIVAGHGGGTVAAGQHIAPREQPIANLWVSVMNALGVPNVTRFGNSDGSLSLT